VRNNTVLTLKNDIQVKHVGCQFINLPKKTERDIQKYLFKLEREQRLAEK
jgi:c-di-GMP-binding flagellar brake protein YcgR